MISKNHRSGDDCPHCPSGWLYVYCSRVEGENRIRYLRCRSCKRCPDNNIEVVPIDRRTRMRQQGRLTRESRLEEQGRAAAGEG